MEGGPTRPTSSTVHGTAVHDDKTSSHPSWRAVPSTYKSRGRLGRGRTQEVESEEGGQEWLEGDSKGVVEDAAREEGRKSAESTGEAGSGVGAAAEDGAEAQEEEPYV